MFESPPHIFDERVLKVFLSRSTRVIISTKGFLEDDIRQGLKSRNIDVVVATSTTLARASGLNVSLGDYVIPGQPPILVSPPSLASLAPNFPHTTLVEYFAFSFNAEEQKRVRAIQLAHLFDHVDASFARETASQTMPEHPPSSDDPFSMLGVTRASTSKEVKKAYLDLVKQWHPDLIAGAAPFIKQRCEAQMKTHMQKLNNAYEHLMNRQQTASEKPGRSP